MSDASSRLVQAFTQAFETGALQKCTLSKPALAPEGLQNVYIRPVLLKKGKQLAFNFRYKTRDEVKNHPIETAIPLLENLLAQQFRQADLFTETREFSLSVDKKGVATMQERAAAVPRTQALAHDRPKQRLLDPSAPWLHQLGITNARGEVLAAQQDKWRQINKYLEIIDSLLRERPLPPRPVIADMGSGKGYLTFALYDFLSQRLGLAPQVTGIELRAPLVELCNRLAQEVGFEQLRFVATDIADYQAEHLDMLIALHACDTATDLALAAGIQYRADILVVAPCCHKQIRKEMQAHNEMEPLLRYGILEERQAEILTDGIRALLLEAEGYRTKVFEFISTEHTAKNVMITATWEGGKKLPEKRAQTLAKVEALKTSFGIKQHWLEHLLEAKQQD